MCWAQRLWETARLAIFAQVYASCGRVWCTPLAQKTENTIFQQIPDGTTLHNISYKCCVRYEQIKTNFETFFVTLANSSWTNKNRVSQIRRGKPFFFKTTMEMSDICAPNLTSVINIQVFEITLQKYCCTTSELEAIPAYSIPIVNETAICTESKTIKLFISI